MASTDDDKKLIDALYAHVSALTTNPATQIAWPRIEFTPPAGIYLELYDVPLAPRYNFLNGETRDIRGILQINIIAPKGEGFDEVKAITGQLCHHFKNGTKISGDGVSMLIVRQPYAAAPFVSDDKTHTPVKIQYRAAL